MIRTKSIQTVPQKITLIKKIPLDQSAFICNVVQLMENNGQCMNGNASSNTNMG